MEMTRLTHPATDADHVSGTLAAPVVIVEYGDYDCPHTRAANAILKQLAREQPARFALVFRFFPLTHIHQNAQALALLMKATARTGRYWEAHDAVMAIQSMSLPAAEAALAGLGLDVEALQRSAPALATAVQRDVERGRADGVHSTPSFFFNGAPWDGHYDLATLRERLAAAPERAE